MANRQPRRAEEVVSGHLMNEDKGPNRVHGSSSEGNQITIHTDHGDRTFDRGDDVELW